MYLACLVGMYPSIDIFFPFKHATLSPTLKNEVYMSIWLVCSGSTPQLIISFALKESYCRSPLKNEVYMHHDLACLLWQYLSIDTLFFFYKNLFYKNVEAEIDPNFKNVLRTFLRLRVD